jgi:type IV secretion system protein VirB2
MRAWAKAIGMYPEGSGVLLSAVNWLKGTLIGTGVTVVTVITLASIGFMLLTNRINWRNGAALIVGWLFLFVAVSMVAGIRSAAIGS